MLEPLRNLNDLGETSHSGINKHWPLKDKLSYELLHDYLQKINFSIQDFNTTARSMEKITAKDVIYIIVLADWIEEALVKIQPLFIDEVLKGLRWADKQTFNNYRGYFRALRSLVVAHPSGTDRHEKLGLGGDFICTDIRGYGWPSTLYHDGFYRLSTDGLTRIKEPNRDEVILSVYNKKDGVAFFQHICFDLNDVRTYAAMNIERLYELDTYLGTLKKKDYL